MTATAHVQHKILKDCTSDFSFGDDDAEILTQRRSSSSAVRSAELARKTAGKLEPAPSATVTSESAEAEAHRLAQRQKQVDYGKNTLGYECYIRMVPRHKRRVQGGHRVDPVTPDINMSCSKRAYDGLIRVWRKALHKYDEIAAQELAVGGCNAVNPEEPPTAPHGGDYAVDDNAEPSPAIAAADGDHQHIAVVGDLQRQEGAGSKRYFQQAFQQGGGTSGTSDKEPSPKKSTGLRPAPLPLPRRMPAADNVLDGILGDGGFSHDGVSPESGSTYVMNGDGSNDVSFCTRLNRLDVQLQAGSKGAGASCT